MLKTILALIGCEYSDKLFDSYCALAKLFGIDCASRLVRKPDFPFIVIVEELANIRDSKRDQCLNNTNYGNTLFMDAVCLLFLIIQKRIFGSYYFNYLVIEVKAQQRLASRGAELIHEIQVTNFVLCKFNL